MRKILFISTMILLSLQIQAQRPINATFVIIRDSLCMKNGGGDSCVTVIMNDTLVNTTWVRNLILAYDSVLHAQYADSAKYADSAGFADTSYFAINIVLASSDGEILFDNSGTIDGAPMSTDGTDITVDNDLDVTSDINFGNTLYGVYSGFPIVQSFLVSPLNDPPFGYYFLNSTESIQLSMDEDLFKIQISSSSQSTQFLLRKGVHGGILLKQGTTSGAQYDTRYKQIATLNPGIINRVWIGNDSIHSEYTQLDTAGFHIEVDGDFDNPDPQYNFYKDSLGIDADVIVRGYVKRWRYEAAAYLHPDSTITTSITTAWEFLGAGENNKFTNIEADGFSLDGDTLLFTQRTDDPRDSIEFHVSYSCESATSNVNQTVYIGIFTKHSGDPDYTEQMQCTRRSRTSTAGVFYPGPMCTVIPVYIKDGDKIQIRAKGDGSTTLSTESFGIYLYEE